MAEGLVDVKRYQIISLLYIVFICFSVINIKISVLDSNIYTIKSLQSLDKEELKKVDISNKIIEDNYDTLIKSPKANSYLKIRTRLNTSSKIVYDVLKHVDDEFAKNNTTLLKQFNGRNLIEEILKDDKGIKILEKDLFELSDFIKKSPYKINTSLDSLIPIQKIVTTIKGKDEKWDYYLFFHKPSAISYMQLERIKLLITKTQLLYQEAALAEIGYQPTYFSQFNPKLYVLKANIKEFLDFQLCDNYYGNKEEYGYFLHRLTSKDSISYLLPSINDKIQQWIKVNNINLALIDKEDVVEIDSVENTSNLIEDHWEAKKSKKIVV